MSPRQFSHGCHNGGMKTKNGVCSHSTVNNVGCAAPANTQCQYRFLKHQHRTPEYFYKRNLVVFLADAKTNTPYTISNLQRVCHVGYNQAIGTYQYGINHQVLAAHENGERWFTVLDNSQLKKSV